MAKWFSIYDREGLGRPVVPSGGAEIVGVGPPLSEQQHNGRAL